MPGDSLTINELLYGLMLPSGNDAAHMLALHFGGILLQLLYSENEGTENNQNLRMKLEESVAHTSQLICLN
jgi:D-alanyl-D-alanine carboxypeptidase